MIKNPYARRYYAKKRLDPEWVKKKLAESAKWRRENRDKISLSEAMWKARNKEKTKTYNAKTYAKHRKERAVRTKAYREANPELIRARREAYAPIGRAKNREWMRNNPDSIRVREAKKRSKKAGGTLTQAEVKAIREQQGDQCFYCWGPLGNNGRGHIEHKTPLIRDGLHAASNIVIACSPCNHRKWKQTAEEFIEKTASPKTIASKFNILLKQLGGVDGVLDSGLEYTESFLRELDPIFSLVSELKEKLAKEVK
jgi:5-methylcytosine-specific restriction endonuclease McrA